VELRYLPLLHMVADIHVPLLDINDIVVDVNHPRATIEMQIHWAGGVHTPLKVRKTNLAATHVPSIATLSN
jgi:hypothetical protein